VLVEKPIATTLEEAEELIALAVLRGRVLTVGHQERFVFAKSGLLNSEDAPRAIECVRAGPWTGRSTDVGVVLDLMIHDLDLVHNLIPGDPVDVRASGRAVSGGFVDEATANIRFPNGSDVTLFASRIADARQRSMRMTYDDGVIEMDFLTREVRNTTRRALPPLAMEDPLGESVAAFVDSVAAGGETLVRPEEARRALETALLIEESVEAGQAHGLILPQGIARIA
jgi:predicted dehydrogenase